MKAKRSAIELRYRASQEDERYPELPFELPASVDRLEVAYTVKPAEAVVDIGILDPGELASKAKPLRSPGRKVVPGRVADPGRGSPWRGSADPHGDDLRDLPSPTVVPGRLAYPAVENFRGYSGGARREFFLELDRATPGYLPVVLASGTCACFCAPSCTTPAMTESW